VTEDDADRRPETADRRPETERADGPRSSVPGRL